LRPEDLYARHVHRYDELRGDSYGDWVAAPRRLRETGGWGRSEWDRRDEYGVYPDERELESDRPRPDRQLGGPHVGKGPKGYHRSAERIREEVIDELTGDPHVDATEIAVEVDRGEVTLTGIVDDRRTKRLAEACADRVEGVRDVHNRLHLRSAARAPEPSPSRRGP
jgi:hypothetical protein